MNKKIVLITGASSGLGREIAVEFASNNYNVIINYNDNKDEAERLKKELESDYNIKALTIKCDISNEEEINNMKKIILDNFDTVDVLINNAAICKDNLFENKNKNDFMKILEVNLVGTFLVSKVFGDLMYKNKKGSIINISSTNGIDTYYEYSLDYDSSKAGVINLTHNLANHYSPYVRVNAVCPGWIDTPMNKDMDPEFKEKELSKILLNRFASPKEISSLVYFLSSDKSSYINDSIIRIDGGKRC